MAANADRISIRPVRVEDAANGLWDVYSQLTKAPPLSDERMSDIVNELTADPYRELVVAVDANANGSVIGTASLILERKLLRGGALCAHIEDVVVCKSTRGRGLGKKLVTHLVDIAKSKGCYKVILDCAENNVAFYERCGFMKKECQMALYLQ